MAKQRRRSPRPVPRKRATARRPERKGRRPASGAPTGASRQATGSVGTSHADSHEEAVRTYERGVEALQQHDFRRAEALLLSVLNGFPDEKELHERVRLYVNVCRRQAAPPDRTPRTVEERVYAATLAINAGAYDTAETELRAALQAAPDHGNVHYMLAVVHALRADFSASVSHLQRSIEINPENRFLALQDEDLAPLRDADPDFRSTVDAASTTRRERRTRASR